MTNDVIGLGQHLVPANLPIGAGHFQRHTLQPNAGRQASFAMMTPAMMTPAMMAPGRHPQDMEPEPGDVASPAHEGATGQGAAGTGPTQSDEAIAEAIARAIEAFKHQDPVETARLILAALRARGWRGPELPR